jgi:type I restriction enzyme S subunit
MRDKPLPESWACASLSDDSYFQLIMGQSPPGETYNDRGEGLPFFQGKADFGELHPKPRVFCSSPSRIACAGDVLISVRAPVGPTNLADRECSIGRGLAAIRCKKGISSRYLLMVLRCLESEISHLADGQGGGFTCIRKEQLADFKVPIPSLEEQRRLVERIEALTSRLEEARKIRNDVVCDTKAALAATLASIFEGAEDWTETILDEVCTMKTGKTPPTKQPEYFAGDVPFVCPADVGNSLRITEAERTLTHLAITDRKANLFPCGTVLLVGIGSTVGKVGIAAADVCTNQQITGLTFTSRVDPEYAAWFLLSQRKEIVHAAADNGVPIINQNGIGKLVIRFPDDVKEQRRIVERLDALAEKQSELRRLQDETEAELAAFTPALLVKAFRGEL